MDNAMVGSSFTRGFTIVMCHCSTDVKVVSRVHFDLTNNKFDLNVQDTSDNPTAYTIQNGRFQSRFYIRQPKASHVAHSGCHGTSPVLIFRGPGQAVKVKSSQSINQSIMQPWLATEMATESRHSLRPRYGMM
jgi:hypothetical protein